MTARKPLDVWLYGTQVATITDHGREIRLQWSQDAYERWGQGGRVVSHLLPIDRPSVQPHHRRVQAFLAGLLPEGNARERHAQAAGVTSDDIFGMIRAYGKETAGALIFVEQGSPEPDRIGSLEPVNNDQIGAMLAEAAGDGPAFAGHDGNHLQSTSLAGIQPKIVLARASDGWARCLDGHPSTHVAKLSHPPDSNARDVVHTEVASLDLARELGLTTMEAQVVDFDGHVAIVVSRYDRTVDEEGRIRRIHQEDGAQALGINTDDPNRKFQYSRDLPSLKKLAEVLRGGSSEPDKLLALTTFNLAIGNTDAHAKNISFIRDSDGDVSLAPAYDIAMHLHHTSANRTFAMNVNGKSRIDSITVDDLIAEAEHWPMPKRRASLTVSKTLYNLSAALTTLDHSRYPGVQEAAFNVVEERTQGLIGQLT
ncbi:MAG TPA: HipA domain-containing protein [Frankiaceae bacterium]|jgi:serine/threonine-protein kinase HipA|nr:HipA domain-containing protein [Frankiaceae bacterium]